MVIILCLDIENLLVSFHFLYLVTFALQLYMEDLCKQGVEHGSNLRILEAIEQGTKAC